MPIMEILALNDYEDLGMEDELPSNFLERIFGGDSLVSDCAIALNSSVIAAKALMNSGVNGLIFVNILLATRFRRDLHLS